KAEELPGRLHMRGQRRLGGDPALLRMRDADGAGVEVELARQVLAGELRLRAAIFAVAEDWRSQDDAMGAELMRSPGLRHQRQPGGAVARALYQGIARDRVAPFFLVDADPLAETVLGMFGERCVDGAALGARHTDHDRPIDILCRFVPE